MGPALIGQVVEWQMQSFRARQTGVGMTLGFKKSGYASSEWLAPVLVSINHPSKPVEHLVGGVHLSDTHIFFVEQ